MPWLELESGAEEMDSGIQRTPVDSSPEDSDETVEEQQVMGS